MSRTSIAQALKSSDFGSPITVKGWVRTRRGNKHLSFIALNNGTSINNIQVVADGGRFTEEFLKPVTKIGRAHV